MKKVSVAIIGCGMIAESHAKALLADGRAQLYAAAYGSNQKKGAAFAEKFGVSKLVGDYHELLDDPTLDLVCICTPSGLHSECAVAFARAGKHILCEKPLDITHDAMSEMIAAAEENHVKLGCVFPNRMRTGLQRARALLESGELGKMRIVECQYRGYRSPAYYTSSKWKGTKRFDGGGCLMNQGIHAIDAMIWLTGDVAEVCAMADALGRDIEVEDTASALLRYRNGAQGVILGTTLSYIPEGGPEGDRIRIECEKGSILYADGKTTLYRSLRDDDFEVEQVPLDDEAAEVTGSGAKPENIDMEGHQKIVSNMLSAVLGQEEVLIPPRSARRGVDVVLAVYESACCHGWTPVNYGR